VIHIPSIEYINVPSALKSLPNWVCWRLEERGGKKTKIPYNLNGRMASSTDKTTWHTFDEIKHCAPTPESGAGFCFNGDGVVGIDLDHCIEPNGDIAPIFRYIVSELKNTYKEISPSGTGLHIFCKCPDIPYPSGKRKTFQNGQGLEIYSSGRYFTVTGMLYGDSTELEIIDTNKIRVLCDEILDLGKGIPQQHPPHQDTPKKRSHSLTDNEVYNAAIEAKNGVFVMRLLDGNTSSYPSPSEADMALASVLAFYTRDPNQIERIMRDSKLRREKWDTNPKYLTTTIDAAISKCKQQYTKPRERGKNNIVCSIEESNSEVMFADEFVEYLDGNYLYNISTKRWHVWNGICWEVDERNLIMITASEFSKKLFKNAEDKEDVSEYIRAVMKVNTKAGLNNIVTIAGYQLTRTIDDFDKNEHMLNVANGALLFNQGVVTFKEHDKRDMCSLVCSCDYEPSVGVPDLWLKHIETITGGDPDMKQNIQEIFGYMLDGGNPNEHFLILHGAGRNGKSVTLRTIMHIFGDYGLYVNPLTLMETGNNTYSPERLLMIGKRLIVAQEPNKPNEDSHKKDNTCLDSSFIKTASGHDVITARKIHSNEIKHIRINGLITFCTNPLPKVNDDSVAFWERVLTIPFRYVIPGWQRDPTIEDRLKSVSTGILNWMVKGYTSRGTGRFKLCQSIKDDISEYRLTVDEYAGFCHKCVEDTFSGSVDPKTFYDAYCAYQIATGIAPKPKETFLIEMGKRYNKKHTMNGNVYTQISLRDEQTHVV
jgi:putative DNA primase/helicase